MFNQKKSLFFIFIRATKDSKHSAMATRLI